MKVADWKPIEHEYANTRTSVATLSKAYNVSHSTITKHMHCYGIVRNPPSALPAVIDDQVKPVKEVTTKELRNMRTAVIGKHQDHIGLNLKRLEMICDRLDAMTGLSNMQRLNALKEVAKISEIYIKLERQAHNIVEEAPPAPPPVAIQVNVNLDPQAAYLQLIGKK